MKRLLKNPISIWLRWYLDSKKNLIKNKNKHLKIGYMTKLLNVKVGVYNTFYNNIMLSNCTIDDYVYISDNAIIRNTSIGKFCSIGSNVKIGLGIHPTNFISTFPAFFSNKKQCQISFVEKDYIDELGSNKIGNDVWIGENAVIMSNVEIGDGSIIAAGAVVTKNIAPYSIVGGVPASLIRKRFTNEQIEVLLNYKWWNKDIDWIKENKEKFCTEHIDNVPFE